MGAAILIPQRGQDRCTSNRPVSAEFSRFSRHSLKWSGVTVEPLSKNCAGRFIALKKKITFLFLIVVIITVIPVFLVSLEFRSFLFHLLISFFVSGSFPPFPFLYSKKNDDSYLCTYDLYGPMRNVFDACRYITRASGRGLGPGNWEFLGPVKWHRADRRVPLGPVGKSNITALLSPPSPHPELIRNQRNEQETVRCIKERSCT